MTEEHVGREGVPSLRVLLSRARHAGALVEDKQGEVRVTVGDQRTVVSATRKDGTPELLRLVRKAEAEAPKPKAKPVDIPKPKAPIGGIQPATRNDADVPTLAHRIRQHIRDTSPADEHGWRSYSSRDIGDALGVASNQVATWLSLATSAKSDRLRVEQRKEGGRVTAIRFVVDTPSGRPAPAPTVEPTPAADYRDQPMRPVQPAFEFPDRPVGADPVGMLPTPNLAAYAEARRVARQHPMLRVDVTDAERDEVLSEAARLYFWVRASRKE